MSITRFTCLPVRVVCFGISGTEALGGDTACWASTDIAVSIAAAMPTSNTIVVFMEFSCYENRDDDYESSRLVVKRSRQQLREEIWSAVMFSGDDKQVLIRYPHSTLWAAAIPARNELKKRRIEFRDSRWLIAQAGVDGDHRAECVPEQLEVFACTRRGFHVFLRSQGQRLNFVAKQEPHVILRAPEERRPRVRRGGWRVPRQDPKEVATGPARGEVHHANHAAGPTDAQHLARRRLMVGREHCAKTRGHDIELGIGEGKLLCIAFHPFEVDVRVARRAAALVEMLGCH